MLFELMLNYPTSSCSPHNCKLGKHTWNLYYMNLYNTILHMNELSTLHLYTQRLLFKLLFLLFNIFPLQDTFNFNLFFQNYLCQEQTKGKLFNLIPRVCIQYDRLFHIKF